MVSSLIVLPWKEHATGYWILERHSCDETWVAIVKHLANDVWVVLVIDGAWNRWKPGLRPVPGQYLSREEAMATAEEKLKSNYSVRFLTNKLANLIS